VGGAQRTSAIWIEAASRKSQRSAAHGRGVRTMRPGNAFISPA